MIPKTRKELNVTGHKLKEYFNIQYAKSVMIVLMAAVTSLVIIAADISTTILMLTITLTALLLAHFVNSTQ